MNGVPDEAREPLQLISEIGGEALVRQLLETFVRHAVDQLAKAERAGETGDATEVARVAHGLLSSSRQLGAFRMADACARAEDRHKGGKAPEQTRESVAELQREFAAAREWMTAVAAQA